MFKHRNLYLFCALVLSVLFLAACSSTPPALTSGSDTWLLKTVTYPNSVKTALGDTVTSDDANFKFIYAEFECIDNKSLTGLWSGVDDSAFATYSVYQKGGFTDVFITDSKENKYLVVLIEKCGVAGLVPNDGTEFYLHFKDLEPVALGK